jgi:energy-coupling factor transporter ATP-binding protein EcfA2
VIKISDVSFAYAEAENPVFRRANLEISSGEFVLVCGPTGSGKSTFLKIFNGLAPHFTAGTLTGTIEIDGQLVSGKQPHELAGLVGYVNQQPEGSFVSDTVEDEIAYSLEQLGFAPNEMHSRVKHYAGLLGIGHLLSQNLTTLSGGQQQRVAIASALAAGQKVLVLDEPTSALDPVAADEIVDLLMHLAHNEGITVLLAEHRLERVISKADSVIVVNGDSSVNKFLSADAFKEYRLVPPIVELSQKLGWHPVALDPREVENRAISAGRWVALAEPVLGETSLSAEGIVVEYGHIKAVQEVTIAARAGEVLVIMGKNGSGKSSLLWAVQGIGEMKSGKVSTPWGSPRAMSDDRRLDLIAMVPQKAADLLFLNSLSAELAESDRVANVAPTTTASIFAKFAGRVDPKIHPRDISAGQQLALVLALQLVKDAPIVLLDEPTRGLDYAAKHKLAEVIAQLQAENRCVVLASHDIEFVAQVANRIVVLENGQVIQEGSTAELLGHIGALATQVALALKTTGLISVSQVKE